ncbi:phage tail tube protein [Methylobacterium nodulans]|uniref:Uncharacterized protein n=1 Tax=Methylobacterium nodulans (strain LMG 21967 / CNCM I-2342 / ORS 2060) TaxID=460265 RepID=B8IIM8_METNO|nr:phage tail tube protein [Methylobacterium nodulans]ACL59905.1 conserved hypothetical protein [Methylobacterium nodulans ORS 2060]
MAIAAGSGRQIAYVLETAYGEVPATPTFTVLRSTGGGPRTDKATAVSDEIRADRNVSDEQQLGQDVTGGYNFELSYGSLDDILEAALCGTWAGNVLKNGTVQRSLTFEERLDLGGGSFSFSRFSGCVVNTFALATNSRALITGSFDLLGRSEALDSAIIAGATYTAANTKPIQSASGSVAGLTVGGATSKVRQLSLAVANNGRNRPLVGSLYTDSIGLGRADVTGSLQVYFETNTLYQRVLNHEGGAISFTVGTVANEKYTVSMPNAVFLNGERQPGGNTDDVMVTIPFRARFDSGIGASIQITRGVA